MTIEKESFNSRRSAVYSTRGMVACSQPLAAQVGIDILKKGGNAADAAVAVAFVLSLIEPMSSGIGGDAFCLYYNAKTHQVNGLDGSGRTPAALTLEHALRDPLFINVETCEKSIHSFTVPGALAAYEDTLKCFGSKKISLIDVISPTVEMAENGVPIPEVVASNWRKGVKIICENGYEDTHDWVLDGNRGPEEGEIVTMPSLAKTYRQIISEGTDAFYKGSIGKAIIDTAQSRGSLMTMDDLRCHKTTVVDPISIDYHGSTIWQVPSPSQGVATLIALGIIEALEEHNGVDFSRMEQNSAEYIHIITEALRLAFADMVHHVYDPNSSKIPLESLLNKEYLRERAKLISFDHKNNDVKNGYPLGMGNTTFISVVDPEGNACSLMSSLCTGLYELPCVSGTGIALQNRGGFFSHQCGHPNAIGPSKKPLHTLMPSIITRRTDSGHHILEASIGIIGAFMQHQGQLQLILGMKHYSSNPQRVIDMPRLLISPTKETRFHFNKVAHNEDSVLYLEHGFSKEVANELEKKGHICINLSPNAISLVGRAQLVISKIDSRSGKRVLVGGSEPRTDGQAQPW